MTAGSIVHRFGGTSFADADRYRAPYEDILSERSGKPLAVVQAVQDEKRSATSKV